MHSEEVVTWGSRGEGAHAPALAPPGTWPECPASHIVRVPRCWRMDALECPTAGADLRESH